PLREAERRLKELPDKQCAFISVDARNAGRDLSEIVTQEQVDRFRQKLRPGGVLAIRVFDPTAFEKPAFQKAVGELRPFAAVEEDPRYRDEPDRATSWLLVADKEDDLKDIKKSIAASEGDEKRWQFLFSDPGKSTWTDDFSNLLSVFQWR